MRLGIINFHIKQNKAMSRVQLICTGYGFSIFLFLFSLYAMLMSLSVGPIYAGFGDMNTF